MAYRSIADAAIAGTQAKQVRESNQLKIEAGRMQLQQATMDIKRQEALDEIKRTATYVEQTVLPMLKQGKTDELKQNLSQRIAGLDAKGVDSSGSRQALKLLEEGKIDDLRRTATDVVQVAVDNKLLPERYEQIYQDGRIVGQRSTLSGKEIASPRAGEALKGKRRNAQDEQGNIVPAIEDQQGRLLNTKTGKPEPTWIIAPRRTETAAVKDTRTPSQQGKAEQNRIDAEVALKQNVRDMSKLRDLITDENYVGGTTGQIVSVLNSAVQQVKQVTKTDDLMTGKKLNESVFGKGTSAETLGRFRKAAINNDRFESAILELAFLKAKSLNPDGKISDADVRAAEQILGQGADRASRLAVLDDIVNRTVEHYNISGRANFGDRFKPITPDEALGRAPAAPVPGLGGRTTTDIVNDLASELDEPK